MASAEVTCRVRAQVEKSGEEKISLVPVSELPDLDNAQRSSWARGIFDLIQTERETSSPGLRPFDLVLLPDGTVGSLFEPGPSTGRLQCENVEEKRAMQVYPARYRMPSQHLSRATTQLDEARNIKRQEQFALGSLAYEVMSSHEPFKFLPEDEIVARYARKEFPEDVLDLESGPLILSCWDPDYALLLMQTIATQCPSGFHDRSVAMINSIRNHAQEHPSVFILQATGLLLSTAALFTLPVLGALGFGALGPVAGTTAAAWQASLGLVQAGSLFAWCQSAAMGGAALSGIIAGGAVGAGMAGTATLADLSRRYGVRL